MLLSFTTAILAAAILKPANAAECRIEHRADVALQWDGTGWLAPLVLDGIEAPFLVDTGAERTMVFEDAAARLGLPRDEWVGTTTQGVGGYVRRPNADPRSVTLGGLALRRHTLAADNTLTVGVAISKTASGLLGQDFLSVYDLDLDGAHDRLGLYTVSTCLDVATLPWNGPRGTIRGTRLFNNIIVLPVEIDGRVLQAEIDTGSSATIITAPGMAKLGLTESAMANDPPARAQGIGAGGVQMRRHRFTTVTIGPQRFTGQAFWVGPIHIVRSVDLLLGADWVRSRRVWLSFATNSVVVAINPGERAFGQ